MSVFASATRKITPYLPLLVFFLLACVIALIAFQGFRKIENLIEVEKLHDLGAIVDMKVGQVASWQDMHKKRVGAFSRGALLAAEFEQWLLEGAPAGGQEQKLLQALTGLGLAHGYATASLLDRQGVVRITTGKGDILEGADVKLALDAMSNRQPLFSDIHRSSYGSRPVSLSLASPLIDANVKNGHAVGAILLQIDPHDFLFPLIQLWPSESPSAETLLTRQEGGEVVFLNELRHRKGAALTLRIPAVMPNLPTAMAIRGETSTKSGFDYRGVPVVAAMRRVPGTSWFITSKVDKEEIFAPIEHIQQWATGLGFALAILGGFFFFAWIHNIHARQKQLKVEHDAALEREMRIKHFEYLNKYANDIIVVSDETGRIVEANQRAVEAYGYTREELLQMRVTDIRQQIGDPAVFKDQVRQIMELGELRFEDLNLRKDGTSFPVEVSVRLVDVQGMKYIQGIVRDLTEQKRAEAELRESEARFRNMADSALALIWLSDTENLGTWFSKGWLEYTGRTLEQELGLGWAEGVHPDDLLWCVPYCNEAFKARRRFKMEFRLRRADGSYGWIADTGIPRFSADGEFEGYIGYCWDITEHKQLEEMRAMAVHAGRLNIAGEMVASLAHELSQPLTACNNYLDVCLRRMGDEAWGRERLRDTLNLAAMQAERAGNIVNHLKALVRKQGHERTLIDINLLVRDVMKLLEDEITRQGISLILALSPLPNVMASKVEIEQVLFNLCKNAIEAMCSWPQRELRVSTRELESGEVMIAVSDTGKGILPTEMENLFSPFRTTKKDGLGLGLMICRSIVENHGGKIWMDARREFGAEFCFTLPIGVQHE